MTGLTGGTTLVSEPQRASPAYYPPRDLRQTHQTTQKAGTQSGTNVRPVRTLEGHGDGAVFDVKWFEGGILSAGEDGNVGMWGFDREPDDQD